MKPETADQDELQRMLALKRGEQPPPRFFKSLSSAVIDRIQNPEPPPPPTFWQRLGLDFDTRTVLVCVSGAAVCGLLAYGLVNSRNVKAPAPNETAGEIAPHLAGGSAPGQLGLGAATPVPGTKAGEVPRSTVPVMVNPSGDRMSVRPRPVALTPTDKSGN